MTFSRDINEMYLRQQAEKHQAYDLARMTAMAGLGGLGRLFCQEVYQSYQMHRPDSRGEALRVLPLNAIERNNLKQKSIKKELQDEVDEWLKDIF